MENFFWDWVRNVAVIGRGEKYSGLEDSREFYTGYVADTSRLDMRRRS